MPQDAAWASDKSTWQKHAPARRLMTVPHADPVTRARYGVQFKALLSRPMKRAGGAARAYGLRAGRLHPEGRWALRETADTAVLHSGGQPRQRKATGSRPAATRGMNKGPAGSLEAHGQGTPRRSEWHVGRQASILNEVIGYVQSP